MPYGGPMGGAVSYERGTPILMLTRWVRGTYLSALDSGRGTARAEDAQGTPTQSHISPGILVYEEKKAQAYQIDRKAGREVARSVDRLDLTAPAAAQAKSE